MTSFSGAQASAQRGLILLEQKRYPEAATFFREALGLEPHDAWTLYHLAICQHQQEDPAAAETILRAIRLEPNSAEFHSVYSLILSQKKQYAQAAQAAEAARTLDPLCLQAHVALGAAQWGREDWPAMEEAARRALAIDPTESRAANQLAHALRLQNKMAENAAQIEGMLGREPENARTHASAGWAALQRGERQLAETHFRESLRLDPGSESARLGLLESFKARSGFYRLYLKYCFFMQRWSRQARWAMILGLYLVVRLSGILMVPYLLFVMWSHVAPAIGNLIVLADRQARHALRRGEKGMAIFAGGGIAAGLALILSGYAVHFPPVTFLGFTLAGAAIPFRYAFANDSKAGPWLFGTFGVCILAAGLLSVIDAWVPGAIDGGLRGGSVTVAILMLMGTTWLANVPSLRS